MLLNFAICIFACQPAAIPTHKTITKRRQQRATSACATIQTIGIRHVYSSLLVVLNSIKIYENVLTYLSHMYVSMYIYTILKRKKKKKLNIRPVLSWYFVWIVEQLQQWGKQPTNENRTSEAWHGKNIYVAGSYNTFVHSLFLGGAYVQTLKHKCQHNRVNDLYVFFLVFWGIIYSTPYLDFMPISWGFKSKLEQAKECDTFSWCPKCKHVTWVDLGCYQKYPQVLGFQ